jgi:hypothetical protein
MNIRETFTYFNAGMHTNCIAGVAATKTGADVNRQGYDSLLFLANVQQVSNTTSAFVGNTATSMWFVRMQHTDASALGAGPSDYADCLSVEMIRTWSGAVTSGIALYINPSTMSGTVQPIGYRGNKQYVRCLLSMVNMTMGASNVIDLISLLGHAENWPVTTPNLDS